MKRSRKEFIIEAHKAACEEWKLKIEKEFPKLFKEGSLEALKKEAIKRGYKEGVTCFFGDFKDVRTITSNVFIYCYKSNRLALGKDVIFNKGKWAEIIEATITKKEAEEKLGCKIID